MQFPFLPLALVFPFFAAARLATPTVEIRNGTIVGSSFLSVDSFMGIPFAEPPTGTRRLTPPTPLKTTFGTITATGVPTACPQFDSTIDVSNLPEEAATYLLESPLVDNLTSVGEDCLTLNVQRPSGTDPSSKLPVLFWIFGGGFETGSTQQFNGDAFIVKSVQLGHPIIYVAANYRVGGFGFLPGKELAAQGCINLGLRDQRLALQWVQDNIAAFGGDPSKVTIWGESAGAISVNYQLVVNGGDNSYNGGSLFRAAIGDSGAVNPTLDVTNPKAQLVYDEVVSAAGCEDSTDTISCLRNLSYEDFMNAVSSQPEYLSYSGFNVSYYPRPHASDPFFSVSPEVSFQQGDYVKCPVIVGNQGKSRSATTPSAFKEANANSATEDEGTALALLLGNVTTNDDVLNYFASYFPRLPASIPKGLARLYRQDAAAGAPFHTGDLYELYPQYKRLGALLGDFELTLKRRIYLDYVSGTIPAWSYLSTYDYAIPFLGTFHTSDLLLAYDGIGSPIAMDAVLTYYISFINFMDPNTLVTTELLTDTPLIHWPTYDTTTREQVVFGALNTTIGADTYRDAPYLYLKEHISDLRL